jgi:hypothetical protein
MLLICALIIITVAIPLVFERITRGDRSLLWDLEHELRRVWHENQRRFPIPRWSPTTIPATAKRLSPPIPVIVLILGVFLMSGPQILDYQREFGIVVVVIAVVLLIRGSVSLR